MLFISNCNVLKNSAKNELIIELQTTSCYGTCPVYTLQIYSNGAAILQGKEHMDKIGNFKSKIEKEKLNELISSFEESSFFEFKNSYRSQFLDLPTKYISYHRNGESKKIMAYDNIPKELIKLIEQIDELRKTIEWKKVKENKNN